MESRNCLTCVSEDPDQILVNSLCHRRNPLAYFASRQPGSFAESDCRKDSFFYRSGVVLFSHAGVSRVNSQVSRACTVKFICWLFEQKMGVECFNPMTLSNCLSKSSLTV